MWDELGDGQFLYFATVTFELYLRSQKEYKPRPCLRIAKVSGLEKCRKDWEVALVACNVLSKFPIERCFSRCLSPVGSNSTGRDW